MQGLLDELLEMGRRMERRLDEMERKIEARLAPEAGPMTEHDMQLIVNSDDILGAVDRWNDRHRPPRKRRARG